MGRPPKWSKRQVVDAILYVAATGCQWRALPPQYPHWNTVHRYHLTWSRDGTPERIVDRLRGLVRAANLSDNAGGIAAVDRAATKSRRLKKIWHDSGFKKSFATHCSGSGITSQVVNRVSAHSFEVLPRRWVVERTWAWLVNHRRLRVDYEPDPAVAEGFVWAAHARVLLRRLTQPGPNPTRRAN